MQYFLGIDVGSSKTHALIADEMGRCIGFGKAWGGNHQSAGYDGLENVLRESFDGALKMSGVDKAHIAGAGFGAAGYDFPSDRASHLQTIAKLGLSCPAEVVNDGWNGLLAGATRGVGVNVTAGSSIIVAGEIRMEKRGASLAMVPPLASMAAELRLPRKPFKLSIMRGSSVHRQPR